MTVRDLVTAGDGDPRHGKPGTYTNHGCRCDLCRKAHNAYRRDLYARAPLIRAHHRDRYRTRKANQ